MTKWLNMDTLTKEPGKPVLLLVGGSPVLASWEKGYSKEESYWEEWLGGTQYGTSAGEPEGWCPIPEGDV